MHRTTNSHRGRWIALAALAALGAAAARGEVIERTVAVPMGDGVALEATLFLPPGGGKLPAIVVRTPYDRRQHLGEARFWAANGYAVLVQDARGKFGSGGDYVPFLNERADGTRTLDWVVAQEWSDGRVGMWGSSYLAFCQLVLASDRHPALRSILPISGWLGDDRMIRQGGAYHLMLSIPWILHEESRTKRPIEVELDEMFEFLPLIDVFDSVEIDSRIWNEEFDFSPLRTFSAERIGIPALHVTGWTDFVFEASLDLYAGARRGPAAAEQRLIVGPWFHDQIYTTYTEAGDEDYGPESAMGMEALRRLSLDWFDATLRAEVPDLSAWPAARVFVMGDNEWREFDAWPPSRMALRKLYLGSGAGANSSSGDGYLAPRAPRAPGVDSYLFDPMDPVPTHGGANFHFLVHTLGVKDQRAIERRRDVLVYTSPPLEEDLLLAGPISAVLYAATEGRDTDFTAKLVAVRPDGYARNIEEGILRASYRDGLEERKLLEPGTIYRLEVEIGSTALTIPAGHRLRLEVSSSSFPKYDRNPNTGEEPLEAMVLQPVIQRIHHGASHPSHLLLPVVEGAASPTPKEVAP